MLASIMTFDGKYRRFQTPELVDYIVDWLWEWQQLVIDILTAGCWLPEMKEWNEAGRKEKRKRMQGNHHPPTSKSVALHTS